MSVERSALNVERSGAAGRAVFLSYASQDAEVVRRIADALRAAGVVVWFDQNELTGGDAWDAKIRKQITECALFVPVISAATQSRHEGYFRLEWKLAAQRTHMMSGAKAFLLPVVIDATRDAEAHVPVEFKTVQWTRLGDELASAPFAERVQRLLGERTEVKNAERPSVPAPTLTSGAAPAPERRDEGFRIAVLPFKHRGADPDVAALADGMTEGVVAGLCRFSYLRVIANSPTTRYAQEVVEVRGAGRELGARYVMEGSLRQSGGKLRVTVQLVDASTGSHLWAQHYDRPFNADAVFDLQDDLVARIVATVADADGVLVLSMSDTVRKRELSQLTPDEAFLRFCGFGRRYTAAEHAELRTLLERIVEQTPGHGDCWAAFSMIYSSEYFEGFNPLPDPVGRAAAAAHRAITLNPTSAFSFYVLARCLYGRREIEGFLVAAEQAIAINPLDCASMALLGNLVAYSGEWDRGRELVRRAHELNPNHPGWYWFPDCLNAYRQADYRGALEAGLKFNMPGYCYAHLILAATYAEVGHTVAAGQALQELLALRPNFAATARADLDKYYQPELVQRLLGGLRKAGLEIEAPSKS